jgi:hypothetical protein
MLQEILCFHGPGTVVSVQNGPGRAGPDILRPGPRALYKARPAALSEGFSGLSLAGLCYDIEVGENRVRVFYGTEKREGERVEIYTGGIGPCSSTVYQICNIMYICNSL